MEAATTGKWEPAPRPPKPHPLAPLHDHLVRLLAPAPGENWLDLGTGTGKVAIRAARTGARVIGVDLAPSMVRTARHAAAAEGVRAYFVTGDAQHLRYPDAHFDVVASALGVFLALDHRRAAAELARVTRPGGRLGTVAWRTDPVGATEDRHLWGREAYVRELLRRSWELRFVDGVVDGRRYLVTLGRRRPW
jgi:ubiquinone/menaquinone biosynthesis C-methylase UbiE